jgi:methylated-DNA-[protein]-cysteine S-methyltransferase
MTCEHVRYRLLDTPTGPFAMIVAIDGTVRTMWIDESSSKGDLESMTHDPMLLGDLAERLCRYFDGEMVDFSDVPTPAATPFHQRCWEACRRIPRGQTISYAQLAEAAGSTAAAARAAGQAMRNNRLPIIIPCHRVVATGGGLGGFSGSSDINGTELNQKRFLLNLERAKLPALQTA